jgi:hypothetical protein
MYVREPSAIGAGGIIWLESIPVLVTYTRDDRLVDWDVRSYKVPLGSDRAHNRGYAYPRQFPYVETRFQGYRPQTYALLFTQSRSYRCCWCAPPRCTGSSSADQVISG